MSRRWPVLLVAIVVAGLIWGQTEHDLVDQVRRAIDEASRFETEIAGKASLQQDELLLQDFETQTTNLAQLRSDLDRILASGTSDPERSQQLGKLATRAEEIRSGLELLSKIIGAEERKAEEARKAAERRPPTPTAVEQLRKDVHTLIRRARRAMEGLPAEEVTASGEFDSLLPARTPAIEAAVGQLATVLQRAEPLPDSESELRVLRVDLSTAIAVLSRAVTDAVWTPPGELINAARAYFSGDYDRVEGILGGTDSTDPRARFFSSLFRGAARYAIYLIAGSADADLEQRARAELTLCRQLDGDWTPGEEFSPRIREFFDGIVP